MAYHIIHHYNIKNNPYMQSESYRCNMCEMLFVNPEELAKHKTVVHINKMYQCQSCNKFFGKKQEFEKHTIKVHSEKNQYNQLLMQLVNLHLMYWQAILDSFQIVYVPLLLPLAH
jgi:uncharacterized C2H2 Zn-finger protein